MATAARASSFLPTIKCSNCNAEIEISLMGDHICSQAAPAAPAAPIPSTARLLPFAGPSALSTQSSRNSRPPKNPPSHTSSFITNRPQPPRIIAAHTSTSTASSLRSPSLSSDEGSKRSYQASKQNLPTPITPSSPEMLPQDSAFPFFPTRKAQPALPSPSLESHYPSSLRQGSKAESERSEVYAPLSPSENGGGNVLKRMNTIAPGPFNARKKESLGQALRRSVTSGDGHDLQWPSSKSIPQASISRPSTAAGVTRNPSLSSIADGPRSTVDHDRPEIPSLPSASIAYLENEGKYRPQSPEEKRTVERAHQENRSSAFPLNKSMGKEDRKQPSTRTSAHRPKPSMSAAATRPLNEIGSFSTFKPSRSLRSRGPSPAFDVTGSPQRTTPASDGRQNQRTEEAPPVPKPTRATEYGIGNSNHTSHDSVSSNGSIASDGARTGSSRSSPPLNESPQRNEQQRRRPDALPSAFHLKLHDVPEPAKPMESPLLKSLPMSFSRPMYSQPNSISPLKQQPDPSKQHPPRVDLPPLPQMQFPPHLQQPHSSPLPPPFSPTTEDFLSSPNLPLQNGSLRLSPAPPRSEINSLTSSTHSRTSVSPGRHPHKPRRDKGMCRGCSEPIKGKSVSSADGRLTGRYHKGCFVCKTCKEPFASADFYVHENEPFCARHYHEVNGSLCGKCDRGVEGEYLDDGRGGKFHMGCFTCSDCHTILHEEYYEHDGRSYCHQHVMRAFHQSGVGDCNNNISGTNAAGGNGSGFLSLGGERHPERRITRLMMMNAI